MTKAQSLDLLVAGIEMIVNADGLTEPHRARLHALTRKVRMTDRDLDRIVADRTEGMTVSLSTSCFVCAMYEALLDLRDRYEESGKYAVSDVSAPETQPEEDRGTETPAPAGTAASAWYTVIDGHGSRLFKQQKQ